LDKNPLRTFEERFPPSFFLTLFPHERFTNTHHVLLMIGIHHLYLRIAAGQNLLLLKVTGFLIMSKNERPYRRHLFTVRLWQEEPGASQTEWHGQVQYSADGEKHAFRDWPELVAFFVAKLGEIKNDEEI
jgi:hypothetical protein